MNKPTVEEVLKDILRHGSWKRVMHWAKEYDIEGDEMKHAGAICLNGMCPYVPCVDFPKCGHIEEMMK